MFSKTPQDKLVSIKEVPITPADQVLLNMLGPDRSDLGQMTLESALSLIKPHTFLAHVQTNSPLQQFQIKSLRNPQRELADRQRVNGTKYKRAGRGKEFHLTTETPAGYLMHVLNKSCEYLLQGSRIELSIRQRRGKGKLGPSIDFALKNLPQLRPDTILRSMPEGTTMLAQPCIAPEASPKTGKRASRDPTLIWVMENKLTLKRASLQTPKRIKDMAKWDLGQEPKSYQEAAVEGDLQASQPVRQEWKIRKRAPVITRNPTGRIKPFRRWEPMKFDLVS